MHLQNPPKYYVKYKIEENKVKALIEIINKERVAEVTAVEEKNINIRRVALGHCFGDEETTRRRKMPRWLL